MCRWLKKENLTRKKNLRLSQVWRREYWEHIREVKAENFIFLDKMGVLLEIMREHGRSLKGQRLYDKKPFYRGERVTVIGAMTQEKIKEKLVPQLWEGA